MEIIINNIIKKYNNNMKSYKFIRNDNINFKYITLIFICLIFNIYSINLSKIKLYYFRRLNSNSEIIITTFGKNIQNFLSDYFYFNNNPYEILINGNVQTSIINYALNLQNDENEITLKWNIPITYCDSMFNGINIITKIDLSNFDSSKVTSMSIMFYNCISLTSINFNNFDTSHVINMYGLFYNCYSLQSINLNNFNTYSVTNMVTMFLGC